MKGNIFNHSFVRQLTALALFALTFSGVAVAQTETLQTPPPKANLIIERDHMRFDLRGDARSWQLEVFNQSNDLIFSSGAVSQATLEWTLADQQAKPLADGLYIYTLKFWNENNEQVSVQRGHVMVNRAGSGDHIWVTSNNSTGVGSAAELTVVGSMDSTVGGARLPETSAPVPARAIGEGAQTRPARESGASADPLQVKDIGVLNALGAMIGDGTPGRISKFTAAHTIADSAISESGGNILIGTNLNLGRLNVVHTDSRGIYGRSDSAAGVWGQSISAQGVYGYSSTGVGAEGYSLNGLGVRGLSNTNHGVLGSTVSAGFAGLFGINNAVNGKGAWGRANNGGDAAGVYGESTDGRGVFGESQMGTGVRGQSDSGAGVYGIAFNGRGVWGVSANNNGVYGSASANHGVYGLSDSAMHAGVYGRSTNNDGVGVLGEGVLNQDTGNPNKQDSIGVYGLARDYGVVGVGPTGHGVAGYGSFLGASIYGGYGINGDKAGWAGFFNGDVEITGSLNANSFTGNFASKIDHPLDPANKYLNQSFIESPEMMSVQTGNVITDANGEAVVALPDYFPTISGDFRYQLTVVGQFAQAIVARKIEGASFTIKTDKPNVEVSWQVTGVRQDAAAKANRKPAEQLKSETERGHYLRPELFGQPEEKSIEWSRNPEMMKRMKAERIQRQNAQAQRSQR